MTCPACVEEYGGHTCYHGEGCIVDEAVEAADVTADAEQIRFALEHLGTGTLRPNALAALERLLVRAKEADRREAELSAQLQREYQIEADLEARLLAAEQALRRVDSACEALSDSDAAFIRDRIAVGDVQEQERTGG